MTGKRNIIDNILALNSNEGLHDSEVITNTVYVYEFNHYWVNMIANHIILNDIEFELTPIAEKYDLYRCSDYVLETFHT